MSARTGRTRMQRVNGARWGSRTGSSVRPPLPELTRPDSIFPSSAHVSTFQQANGLAVESASTSNTKARRSHLRSSRNTRSSGPNGSPRPRRTPSAKQRAARATCTTCSCSRTLSSSARARRSSGRGSSDAWAAWMTAGASTRSSGRGLSSGGHGTARRARRLKCTPGEGRR